jgi:ribosomal protein L37AE/L43A
MGDRFKIAKTDDGFHWELHYPEGFDRDGRAAQMCRSFDEAVALLGRAMNVQCPMCLRGAVVDTDYGWKCEACESYDVAVGCEPPKTEPMPSGAPA